VEGAGIWRERRTSGRKRRRLRPSRPRRRRRGRPSTPTKNEIELVSTVGILNTWRIQEYLDAIGTSERAWSDTPEGTKLFEEIRDELYEIRGWSLLQEIMEAAFHPRKGMPRWRRRRREHNESGLPPIADMERTFRDFRVGPILLQKSFGGQWRIVIRSR
jgi:hypothetical protein